MEKHNSDHNSQQHQNSKRSFLYPHSHYYGEVKPQNLVFNANLQEFSQRVGYITALETSGKISPDDAYRRIKTIWKVLKKSRKELGISKFPGSSDGDSNSKAWDKIIYTFCINNDVKKTINIHIINSKYKAWCIYRLIPKSF